MPARSLMARSCLLMTFPLLLALALAAAVNYSYDAAGRLIRIDYGAGGSIAYTYDKAGNLLSRSVSGGGGAGGTITSVNTAGSAAPAGIAQNTWLEIRGNNLVPPNTAASGVIWSDAPEFGQGKMPTRIGSISVTVNGKPAYIYFYCSSVTASICASDQLNVLSPLDDTTGPVQVVVSNNGVPSAGYTATMNASVPSFFLFKDPYVVATHSNGSLLGPGSLYPGLSTRAAKNEPIVVYGTGFGLPPAAPAPGSASQSGALRALPVCKVGNDPAQVAFAGLIGPGLLQLNLVVPNTDATTGDRAISCAYNGASTPATDILAVQ